MATAPESYGYPGSINAGVHSDWITRAAAARFSVVGKDDWKVTAQPGLDRGIRINAGTGIGDSVMDVFPDFETRSLPVVPSGSQWFLVAARRNWTSPYTTNFVVVAGNATRALPITGVSNIPGQQSDQPVALVRCTAGQTVVQEIIDLRAWAGNGGVEAVDLMGRDILARPGAAVKVGTTMYRYEYAASNGGSFAWRGYSLVASDTGWVNISVLAQGFQPVGSPTIKSSGWTGVQFRVVNGWAMINGAVRRATSWVGDTAVTTLTLDLAPSVKIQGVGCQVDPTASGANVTLPPGSSAASFSAMWPLKAP